MLHSETKNHWRTRSRVLAALLWTAALLALGEATRALQSTTGPPAGAAPAENPHRQAGGQLKQNPSPP